MANLFRSLVRRRGPEASRSTYDLSWYLQNAFNSPFGLNTGIGQTRDGRTTEQIQNNFAGYVNQVYKTNGVVFAIVLARLLLFTEARFQWRQLRSGGVGELFGTPDLKLLERPWPNGTTGELLARMEQDASLGGNFYCVNEGDRLRRLRPDWVGIILTARPEEATEVDVQGYIYTPGGPNSGTEPTIYLPDEVAHWSPIPDPDAQYRGMSWVTPVVREVQADNSATDHKDAFFRNGAKPGLVISLKESVTEEQYRAFMATMNEAHQGVDNAYKTLFVGGGADVTVAGANLQQLDFKSVQGAGETRLCAAGGVPPIIVGLSEGLQSATYCLPGGALVWAQAGPTPIRDLRAGDLVWSHVDGGLSLRRVNWQKQTGTKAIYTITTKNRVLRASGNHPVLARVPGAGSGPSVEWRNVDQLKAGDRVVQVMELPDEIQGFHLPNGDEATPEVMRWLGAYTGDGCLSGTNAVRMCIPTQDRVRDEYEKLPQTLFVKATAWPTGRTVDDGLTPEMVRLRAEGLTYRQIVERMDLALHPMSVRDRIAYATRDYSADVAPVAVADCRNGFRFHSQQAVQWHHDMGVTGTASTKRVPRWVFSLRKELRLAYLAGVVDTDGSVDKRGSLKIQFANRLLVEDVRMLLVGCGIQCSNLYEATYSASVLPNPGKADSYVAWAFVASSADEVSRIPFADWLYRERVEANTGRRRRGGQDAAKAGLDDCLGFFTIRSIDIGTEESVYDIGVDEGRSFVADGIVVHNSNYGMARRKFGDHWARPQWRSACAALEPIMSVPPVSELWYDDRGIAFLREDQQDAATIQQVKATTINTYITAGFTAESSVSAVDADDRTLLVHTGLVSVQLQPPGAGVPTDPGQPTGETGDTTDSTDGTAADDTGSLVDTGAEDSPAPTLGRAKVQDREQLHHYWTRGEGLAKWVESPTPWTTLHEHLAKYMPDDEAKRAAADWMHEVLGYWPGSDENRVTHGHPPRGHKVGPG